MFTCACVCVQKRQENFWLACCVWWDEVRWGGQGMQMILLSAIFLRLIFCCIPYFHKCYVCACVSVCVWVCLYICLCSSPNQRVCVLTMSARGSLNQLIRLLLYLCPATRYTTLLNTRVEKFIALLACRSYHQKYLLPRVIRQFQLISIKNTKTKKWNMVIAHKYLHTHLIYMYVCTSRALFD